MASPAQAPADAAPADTAPPRRPALDEAALLAGADVAPPGREHRGRPPAVEPAQPPVAAAVRDDGAPADIDPARLDVEGLKILNRLHRFGHQAYFVGGCVRDLLLARAPKDYDICTSAHPGEVRALFRNCRLIGKRFRLAHVFFRGGKFIEVATFRASPVEVEEGEELPEDLLITHDNVFGTAEEDARRRDFTINGLFYDIRLGRVIDYVDGRRDLSMRVLRTIGQPEVRMREDPVRLLRAARFAARLDFDIDPATWSAMTEMVGDLTRCSPPRLLEEVFRLLRQGASRRSFEILLALGALRILLPPLDAHIAQGGTAAAEELFARLGALDARLKDGPVSDAVIIASVLAPLAREGGTDAAPSAGPACDRVLEQMVQTARLPRRIADRTRQLLWSQGVLLGERRRRRSAASFRHHPTYPEALAVFEVGVAATGAGRDVLERWKSGAPVVPPAEPAAGGEPGRRRKRRRRRGGARNEDSRGGPGAPPVSQE